MREDMCKVIVERPRLLRGNWLGGGRDVGFRQFMASDERPAKLGIRAGHHRRKWLNENLAPLRRFLVGQAGRPWNKVYAELLGGIDRRNAVQQHIVEHIDGYVLREVRVTPRRNGRGVVFEYQRGWGDQAWRPVSQSYSPLFIDPRTGILRLTHAMEASAKARRERRRALIEEDARHRRVIDAHTELRCAEGIWYEVKLADAAGALALRKKARALPAASMAAPAMVWDVWEKRAVTSTGGSRYAASKRQLGSKEIIALGLAREGD